MLFNISVLRCTSTSLSNTGGSPSLFLSRPRGDFSFLGWPAIFQRYSLTRRPSIFELGLGRVRLASSWRNSFFLLAFRPGALRLTFAPVYSASPSGIYFRLLQENRKSNAAIDKVYAMVCLVLMDWLYPRQAGSSFVSSSLVYRFLSFAYGICL